LLRAVFRLESRRRLGLLLLDLDKDLPDRRMAINRSFIACDRESEC